MYAGEIWHMWNLDVDVSHTLHNLNKHVDVNLAFHNSEQKFTPPANLVLLDHT